MVWVYLYKQLINLGLVIKSITVFPRLNWAGLWKLPVIFVCQNNQYAISQHYLEDNAVTEHIAEYAVPYRNVASVVVDGNDVLAVKEVMEEAVARARKGEGATFIEAKTCRHHGHAVGDPGDYMDKDERKWYTNHYDPIELFKRQLTDFGFATEEEIAAIDNKIEEEDAKAVALAKSFPLPGEERLFEGLFSDGKGVV
jgi:pyruvate dehydrogenase E1 component alpha subunit